jgi:hypothetical protein
MAVLCKLAILAKLKKAMFMGARDEYYKFSDK